MGVGRPFPNLRRINNNSLPPGFLVKKDWKKGLIKGLELKFLKGNGLLGPLKEGWIRRRITSRPGFLPYRILTSLATSKARFSKEEI